MDIFSIYYICKAERQEAAKQAQITKLMRDMDIADTSKTGTNLNAIFFSLFHFYVCIYLIC